MGTNNMEKWIQKAHLKKGAFTAQAEAHGMSIPEFIKHVRANPEKFSGTTKKRAALANTFRKI